MTWSIDRGLICNVLIFLIFFYFIITQQFKNGLIIFFSFAFSWILAIIFLGNEFKFFLENTFTLLKEINYIFGEIHVTPFGFGSGNESFRASKILIAIIFCLIISLNLFIKNKKNHSAQFKLSMLFLAMTSFLTYGYNLGRSGGVHLKEVFGYSIIFIVVLTINYFLQLVSQKKLSFDNFLLQKKIFLLLLFVTSLSVFSLNINPYKIFNFKKRFIDYIYLADETYLHKNNNLFLDKAKNIVKDYNCIQIFTNDAAYLYLLRKKNCTKYYLVFSVGSHEMQNKMINELHDTEIIISSEIDDKGHPKYKLHLVKDFIERNYVYYFEENKKIILKKIN